MARKPRQISSCAVYHFINRGVNKKEIFHAPKDYRRYLGLVAEYTAKLQIQIHHYCLMPNHTHFLLKAEELTQLSRLAHFIQCRYAYYYRETYNWPGQVFQRSFTSKPIQDDIYLLECGRYIERNPLKAGLVKTMEMYPYSSYSFYAYGDSDPLVTDTPVYQDLSKISSERQTAYRLYVCQHRSTENLSPNETLPF